MKPRNFMFAVLLLLFWSAAIPLPAGAGPVDAPAASLESAAGNAGKRDVTRTSGARGFASLREDDSTVNTTVEDVLPPAAGNAGKRTNATIWAMALLLLLLAAALAAALVRLGRARGLLRQYEQEKVAAARDLATNYFRKEDVNHVLASVFRASSRSGTNRSNYQR